MPNPRFALYAPGRDPKFLKKFGVRKEMIDSCQVRNLLITATHEKTYSTDACLLELTHEAERFESLKTPARFTSPGMGVHPQQAVSDDIEHLPHVDWRGRSHD